ncbi:hypothetical protein H4R35_000165 [Dimargaris xerosporica]|nr:hypothetical protein H4R35_000165 [Dimargaris xerosporica]
MAEYVPPHKQEFARVKDFDELESGDHIGYRRARDQYLRESWIRVMELRIVKDRIKQCYLTEGVNYRQNCRDLAELYLDMAKAYRLRGYKRVDGQPPKLPPYPFKESN